MRLTHQIQLSYGVKLFLGSLSKEIAVQPSVYRKWKCLKFKISPVSAVPPACMHVCNCVVVGADMKIAKSATRMGADKGYGQPLIPGCHVIVHCFDISGPKGLNSISLLSPVLVFLGIEIHTFGILALRAC